MVEAPRIRITYENIKFIKGKKIIHISGTSYTKTGLDLRGYTIRKLWYAGKYIYIYVIKSDISSNKDNKNNKNTKDNKNNKNIKEQTYVIRTHMMMYGKIIVNNQRPVNPKLTPFMTWELSDATTLKWYISQITILDPTCKTDLVKSNYNECASKELIRQSIELMHYDVSNDKYFDKQLLLTHIQTNWPKLKENILVDLLLNQQFFPGVGNILQQEALYRCRVLPTKTVEQAGLSTISCLIDELRVVCKELYKSYEDSVKGQPHIPILQIYRKARCPCGHKTITKYLGYHDRRVTWCPVCQV